MVWAMLIRARLRRRRRQVGPRRGRRALHTKLQDAMVNLPERLHRPQGRGCALVRRLQRRVALMALPVPPLAYPTPVGGPRQTVGRR